MQDESKGLLPEAHRRFITVTNEYLEGIIEVYDAVAEVLLLAILENWVTEFNFIVRQL